MEELPELIVRDAAAWRRWLGEHHARPTGVWLVLARKGTVEPTRLTYAEAVEEALQNRSAILHRIEIARRPDRARHIHELVTMLARGETLYPQKRGRQSAGPEPGG